MPDTAIINRPADPTDSSTATFTFTSNLPGATFECALDEAVDRGSFTPCASPDHLHRTSSSASTTSPCGPWTRTATSTRRRPSGSWDVEGIAPPVADHLRPGRHDREPDREVRLLRRGPRPPVRVLARRRRVLALRLAEDLQRRAARPARLRGAGARAETIGAPSPSRRPTSGRSWTARRPRRRSSSARRPELRRSIRRRGESDRDLRLREQRPAGDVRVRARQRRRSPTCPDPVEFTGLTPGPHILRVRAVDLALHVDPSPAELELDGRARHDRRR